MSTYEVYTNETRERIAFRSGFSWLALVLGGVSPFLQGLMAAGAATTLFNLGLLAGLHYLGTPLWALGVVQFLFGLAMGSSARWLRELSAERRGFEYTCTLPANSAGNAIAKLEQVGGEPLPEWRGRHFLTLPDVLPRSMRRVAAMAWLTLKAAFRFRLVLVLTLLLIVTVFVLPSVIMHDGTARGFTQILLTYSLSAVTGLLGLATLWLACGTLSRDIEECQIHVVMSKPIPRWEIWLGKWLGIVILNLGLMAVSGAVIYVLLLTRAAQLKPEQQEVLRREVLVARAVSAEPVPDLKPVVEQVLAERLKDPSISQMDRGFVRKQIEEQVKAQSQVVLPGHFRRWQIQLGADAPRRLKGLPLHLKVKFFTSDYNAAEKTYVTRWVVGAPDSSNRKQIENSLSGETPSEFEIPGDMMAPDGLLTIDCQNWNNLPLLFPLEDGLAVLHREGGFAVNFARGMLILFFWLALLAAVGLACSSRMSFAVSSFVSLAILIVSFSGGVIKSVIEQGGIMNVDHDTGMVKEQTMVNDAAVQVFKGVQAVMDIAKDFSPVDALSSGRSITWFQVARAFFQIVVIMGGAFAGVGMWVLTRREIALPT